jgi:hypothetical protein
MSFTMNDSLLRFAQECRAEGLAEGRAAAIQWRDERRVEEAEALRCHRCADTGLAWWCGKPGQGGKRGPCPRCQKEGSARFAQQLARELWT